MTQPVIVKEPNSLLLARHEFTLLERRIYWLVLQLLASDQTFQEHTVPCESRTFRFHVSRLFASRVNAKHLNTTEIKRTLSRITSRKIELIRTNQPGSGYTSLVPFPYAAYHRGEIELIVLANVVPYFVSLSRGYCQFNYHQAISLKSEYGQLLYPLLCRFLDTGFWKVEVSQLRFLLRAECYNRYANFKQRVLTVALGEIVSRTDLDIRFAEVRDGRFVRWLTFSIRRRLERHPQYQAFMEEVETAGRLPLEERQQKVRQLFGYYRLTLRQQKEILNDEKKLEAFIRAESYVAQGVRDIENPTAYIAASVFGKGKKSTKK